MVKTNEQTNKKRKKWKEIKKRKRKEDRTEEEIVRQLFVPHPLIKDPCVGQTSSRHPQFRRGGPKPQACGGISGCGTDGCDVSRVVDHGGESSDCWTTTGCELLSTSFLSTAVLSQWNLSHGKLGLLSRGKPAVTETRYPTTVHAGCFVFP